MKKLDITLTDAANTNLVFMHILYIVNVEHKVFTDQGIEFKTSHDQAGECLSASFIYKEVPITISRYDYNEENDYMIFASKEFTQKVDIFEVVEDLIADLEILKNGRIEWINETLHDSFRKTVKVKAETYYDEDVFSELRAMLKSKNIISMK